MKPILNFENIYSVDESGNVFSLPKSVRIGINGGIRKQPFKKLRLYSMRSNHLRVYLAKNGKKYARQVHRLVAMAFIPNPNNYPFVNHLDGNPTNNNVWNLEWCTAKHNSIHACAMGLSKAPYQVGSANSNSRLTDDIVRAIRARHIILGNCAKIAREYELDPKHVNAIVNRKAWKHI